MQAIPRQQEAIALNPRTPRTIESWAAQRTGRPPGEVRTSDILRKIRPASGLRYRSRLTGSPLGGRIAPHLRHLEDEEALELLNRADAFLADTQADEATNGGGHTLDDVSPHRAADRNQQGSPASRTHNSPFS